MDVASDGDGEAQDARAAGSNLLFDAGGAWPAADDALLTGNAHPICRSVSRKAKV